VAVVVSFIDCINRRDIPALGRLMTEDHVLQVFGEAPVAGRDANVAAWNGYAEAYPDYCIQPRRLAEAEGRVAVLGHTTGSHLALPPEEERNVTLIWVAEVVGAAVRSWTLIEDTGENRRRYGLLD
jgi:hypothetical protein